MSLVVSVCVHGHACRIARGRAAAGRRRALPSVRLLRRRLYAVDLQSLRQRRRTLGSGRRGPGRATGGRLRSKASQAPTVHRRTTDGRAQARGGVSPSDPRNEPSRGRRSVYMYAHPAERGALYVLAHSPGRRARHERASGREGELILSPRGRFLSPSKWLRKRRWQPPKPRHTRLVLRRKYTRCYSWPRPPLTNPPSSG